MSQADIFYSINNIQFRAVYDDQTKAFTPYVKTDGGTFTLDVSDIQIGAVELKDASSSNRAIIDASGRLSVDGSTVVQPISVASLPLPALASTSANQASIISAIGNTNTALGNLAKLSDTQPVSIAGTVAISLASTTITGSVAVTGTFYQATQPVSGTFWQATQPVSGTFFQATQPVSIAGTVTVSGAVAVSNFPATQPISAVALPLPTGASTEATLATLATQASLAKLTLTQDTDGSTSMGPMVQGLVNESVQNHFDGVLAPLSLTYDGRLRVSSMPADITRVWQGIFGNPWPSDNTWESGACYV